MNLHILKIILDSTVEKIVFSLQDIWRTRLVGKSAVLKTVAVRLGSSSLSSSANKFRRGRVMVAQRFAKP